MSERFILQRSAFILEKYYKKQGITDEFNGIHQRDQRPADATPQGHPGLTAGEPGAQGYAVAHAPPLVVLQEGPQDGRTGQGLPEDRSRGGAVDPVLERRGLLEARQITVALTTSLSSPPYFFFSIF